MKLDISSLADTKWVCKYHIVFTPKYRRKMDYWGMREDIRDIIRDLCKWKGVAIIEGKVMPDHALCLYGRGLYGWLFERRVSSLRQNF